MSGFSAKGFTALVASFNLETDWRKNTQGEYRMHNFALPDTESGNRFTPIQRRRFPSCVANPLLIFKSYSSTHYYMAGCRPSCPNPPFLLDSLPPSYSLLRPSVDPAFPVAMRKK